MQAKQAELSLNYFEGCSLMFNPSGDDHENAIKLMDAPDMIIFDNHEEALKAHAVYNHIYKNGSPKQPKYQVVLSGNMATKWSYPLYVINDDLSFITDHNVDPAYVSELLTFKLYTESAFYIKMIKFIKNDLGRVFSNAYDNNLINNQISRMNNQLLIDIHDHTLYHIPCYDKTIQYDFEANLGFDISSINSSKKLGDRVCLDLKEAKKLFHEATYGILDDTFPRKDIVFAGGFVEKILTGKIINHSQSDIDIFVLGSTHEKKKATFEALLAWFDSKFNKNIYYTFRGSVVNIYIVDFKRKFQIIINNNHSIFSILEKFDMSHIGWAYDMECFWGLPEAVESLQTKCTIPMNLVRASAVRFVKALYSGYSIKDDPRVLESGVDLNQILSNNDQVRSYLEEILTCWFPESSKLANKALYNFQTIAMCKKDSNGHYATDDISVVFKQAIIGGNFEDDYNSNPYTNFKVGDLVNTGLYNKGLVFLSDKFGILRMLSDDLIIDEVADNPDGDIILTMTLTKQFEQFLNVLDDTVFKKYIRCKLRSRLVNDHKLKITITKSMIDHQQSSGKSIIRTVSGQRLEFTKDSFSIGDKSKVFFKICMSRNTANTSIRPLSLTKYD